MTKANDEEDAGLVSVSDAADIGLKIVEMADRLKAVSRAVPSAQAKWSFEIDGDVYVLHMTRG